MSYKFNSYFRILALAKKDWKNGPNILTIIRGILSLALFVLLVWFWQLGWAPWVYVAAALTDMVDGWWARTFHQETLFGKFIDPMVDKVLVAAVGIGLCIAWWPEKWVIIPIGIIIVREAGVMVLVNYYRDRGKMLPVTWEGKVKTFAQGVAFFLLMKHLEGSWAQAARYILVVAVTITVTSGIDYIIRSRGLLQPIPEDDAVD